MSDLLEKLRRLDSLCPQPMGDPVYLGAQVFVTPEDTQAMIRCGQSVVIGRGTLREIIDQLSRQEDL